MLGKKWWPIGCDPYKITTEDFKQELLGLDLNHSMRLQFFNFEPDGNFEII